MYQTAEDPRCTLIYMNMWIFIYIRCTGLKVYIEQNRSGSRRFLGSKHQRMWRVRTDKDKKGKAKKRRGIGTGGAEERR